MNPIFLSSLVRLEDVKHIRVVDYRDAFYFVKRHVKYRRDNREYFATPKETLAKGYGDCDDISILYTAILRNLGYNAYVRIVELPPSFHAFTVVKNIGAFDPSMSSTPINVIMLYKGYPKIVDFNDLMVRIYNRLKLNNILGELSR